MSTRNEGIAAFLAISFGGAWLWLLIAHLGLRLSALHPLLQLPAFCMPGIAALIVRRWVTKEGFADAGLRPHLKGGWPYYLAAWLGPLLTAAATVGLAAALGLWRSELSPLNSLLPGIPGWAAIALLMLVVPFLIPLYWGEEFGWTSYLRPRLYAGRTAPSLITTSLIWATWHYPLAFIGYIEFSDLMPGLAAWTVSFLCQEIILAWLYQRSGSVWVASLAHAGNNMVLFLITGQLLGTEGGLSAVVTTLLPTVPMAALSAWIVLGRGLTPRRDHARPAHRVITSATAPTSRGNEHLSGSQFGAALPDVEPSVEPSGAVCDFEG
ncbi:lysostaphin resistance A-like protein [Streptomyces sp. NPDC101150]|uniref:CPBP family intramembrane glutamic endopeptidase n=1 Tax=Streptomyces sp. NPDC101150 TaxID=3366114 RepID=UPI00381061F8